MPLPATLQHAITRPDGGRVVLITGAGCSYEPPTNLPLGNECAREAHRQLVADGVLADGACTDPLDLSVLAEAVATASGGQQVELVRRLPRDELLLAIPNEGHRLAAALLREQALACVLTLNFDLAMSTALADVGARGQVTVISGPEDHQNLGTTNLIYLHRNAHADPERWILRKSDLESGWRDGWGEAITRRVLTSPVVVFVGLGSPAAVLIESARLIRNATGMSTELYHVDPGELEQSRFFVELGLSNEAYLRLSWCDFMRALTDRVLEEYRIDLERVCRQMCLDESWDDEDFSGLTARLMSSGLLDLGHLRARWMLAEDRPYLAHREVLPELMADLLLGVGLIERTTQSIGVFRRNGQVEFRKDSRVLGSVVIGSGRGHRRWLTLEAKLADQMNRLRRTEHSSRFALVAGVVGQRPTDIAPPVDIASDGDPTSIVTGGGEFEMISVDEIRSNPVLAHRLVA